MRRSFVVLLVVAMLATACGSGDDGASGSGGFEASVWVHASTGLEQMFELDVIPGAEAVGGSVELTVGPGTLDDLAADAEAAARSGDHTSIVVPRHVGEQLLAAGVLVEPWSRIWSYDEEEGQPPHVLDLSLIVGTPAAAALAAGLPVGSPGASVRPVDWVEGCWVDEAPTALAFRGAEVAEQLAEFQQYHDYYVGVADGMTTNVRNEVANKAAWELAAKAIARKYGAKVAARIAARFNPITGALITGKDIAETLIAAVETADAINAAALSSTATAGDFMAEIQSKATELAQLELSLRNCEISGAEGQVEAEALATSGLRLEAGAEQAIEGVYENGDEVQGDLLREMLERVLQSVRDQQARATKAASEKAESELDEVVSLPGGSLGTISRNLTGDAMREFAQAFTGLDPSNPFTHSNGQLKATAEGDVDIVGTMSFGTTIDEQEANDLFGPDGTFPCGGWNLCPFGGDLPVGDVQVIGFQVGAEPPSILDGLQYQYGIVFDVDGDTSNNYEASASFPKDTFDGSDRWYQVLLGDAYGAPKWELRVDDATGGSPRQADSSAVLIQQDDAFVLVVEESEVPPTATFRVTSFRHTGDFGMQAPNEFSGDVFPEVGEPLAPLSGVLLP